MMDAQTETCSDEIESIEIEHIFSHGIPTAKVYNNM